MSEFFYREDTHHLIGLCMEIHRELGKGHDEVIYKDALVVELNRATISFMREKKYEVIYKGVVLPHLYYADFVVLDKMRLLQNPIAVAQTSQSAESRISKSAGFRTIPGAADWEVGDTAGLETCATDFCRDFKILLEAKAVEKLTDAHVKQVLNYLAASKLRLGLLVNFGADSLEWKRVVL